MADLDYRLIHRARQLVNGANVHNIGTLILCYEMSPAGSGTRTDYERKLRELVASKELILLPTVKGYTQARN
jgi:hypothetical protein